MLLLAFFTFAQAQEAIKFEIADPTPDPGERIWWRASWTNHRADPVQVPADLLDRLSMRVTVNTLTSPRPTIYESTWVDEGAQTAKDTQWRTVAPFATIERFGDLSTFVPECRPGCPPGSYQIEASLTPPDLAPGHNQLLPALRSFEQTLPVEPAVLPVLDPDAATVLVRSATRKKDAATLDVTVVNNGSVTALLPGERVRVVECDWSWVRGRVPSTNPQRTFVTGQGTWEEADGTLLSPGQALDITVACDAPRIPAGSQEIAVVVRLRPAGRYLPTRDSTTPFWFAGELESDPSPVTK